MQALQQRCVVHLQQALLLQQVTCVQWYVALSAVLAATLLKPGVVCLGATVRIARHFTCKLSIPAFFQAHMIMCAAASFVSLLLMQCSVILPGKSTTMECVPREAMKQTVH
jgi:hypothetical protein